MSVIIVGGGMAGATLALAISSLTQGKVPVALVEAQQPDSRAHPALMPGPLRWRRAHASNWTALASGRYWPIVPPPLIMSMSVTAATPAA